MATRARRVLIGGAVLALAVEGLLVVRHANLSGGGTTPPPAPVVPVAQPPTPELPEEETSYLWEIEHRGNVLNRYGFRPLADALVRADQPALLALLARDFTGQGLSAPRQVRQRTEVAEVLRQED